MFPEFPDDIGLGAAKVIPDRLKPRLTMVTPSTMTNTALIFNIRWVNLLLNKELTALKPNINGTVPRLNRNIEVAPAQKLPVPKAYNCIVCNGPQGINPFSKPM